MDRIAFIIGNTFLYWNSIILTLAAGTAVCLFLGFYLGKGGSGKAAAACVPLAMVCSLVLGRFCHWYCRADSYSGFLAAMTDYTSGGYALMGAFAGCILTASLLALLGLEKRIFRLTDAMCLGGGFGIALGRLACFYTAADRGQILESVTSLPWAYPVTNTVSGVVEYRLATFVLQAMITGAICLGLALYYRSQKCREGDTTALFALLYGASQAILDSTRYDSLYMRSNGFISFVQLLGAVAAAVVCVLFSVRLVKRRGWKKWYAAIWIVMAALLGTAGYMEYHVQRHGDQAVFAYSVMGSCLTALCIAAIVVYCLGRTLPREM